MDFLERNKKVAIVRWKRVRAEQKRDILKGKDSLVMKAVSKLLKELGMENNYYEYSSKKKMKLQ